MTDAFIEIPGVRNFRDAGGIGGLRRGVLFRSGSFHTLTEEGARRLKALGLRTVIDLRSPVELEVWPDQRHGLDLDSVNLPTLPANREDVDQPWPEDQAALYPFMGETGGRSIAGVVRLLADPATGPAVVHCAVGKDRTGLTIAVLQSLLGADEDEITADFLRSNLGLGLDKGPVPYVDETGTERVSRPVGAEHLASALDTIRTRHGSLPAFLAAHGVTEDELAALRANLS
ncbi:tyrosine-protein phosphatase [Streptomyces rubellomurinus]|uniref:Tyrosine specific protein phosphatases domain-containing protein n=1 Tax=Streptomyces rubellomurinus (strain ATCC 31215) TaxID=359131 RepID=A0A0F2T7V6_STRR3|nr:tyrosine-protein phosphatase [Streptomyces rubellomurinus]KJS59298.1 hypothetical protein VM95_27895 [Streptomyces rubellomurinus]